MRFVLPTLVALLFGGCAPIVTTGDNLIVIEDPDSDFSTDQIYDATGDTLAFDDEENLRFGDAAMAEWPLFEDLRTPETRFFRIRFGTSGGERRAYFTEDEAMTVCDLVLENGSIGIYATTTPVPSS
jgi:hypothetical protein